MLSGTINGGRSIAGITPDGDLETWAEGQSKVKQTLLKLKVNRIIIALPSYKIRRGGRHRVGDINELSPKKFTLVIEKNNDPEILRIIERFKKYVEVETIDIVYARK